jgi:hypothetical protein
VPLDGLLRDGRFVWGTTGQGLRGSGMLVKDNLSPKHTRGIRDFETGYGMVIVQFRSFPLAYVENGRDQSRGPFI